MAELTAEELQVLKSAKLAPDQMLMLETHVGKRARALGLHEQFLAKEISKGTKQTAFHTISRHGCQTSWEAQLIRLMTGETPDQPFAQTGVRAQIREWEKSTGETGSLPERGRNIRYAAADSVGAFLGPEVETSAISLASQKTRLLQTGTLAEMETGPQSNRVIKWEKYKYIECIVKTVFDYAGVSFVRDKSHEKPTKEDFEEALADYLNRGLFPRGPKVSLHDEMVYRQAKKAGTPIPEKIQEMLQVRFPNLADLLEYLHVKSVMMKHVRLVLKRVPENSCTWKLHTAYAVNEPLQLRPDAPGKWTGRIKVDSGSAPITVPV